VGVEAAVKIGTKENVPGAGIREAGCRKPCARCIITIGLGLLKPKQRSSSGYRCIAIAISGARTDRRAEISRHALKQIRTLLEKRRTRRSAAASAKSAGGKAEADRSSDGGDQQRQTSFEATGEPDWKSVSIRYSGD